MSLQCRMQKIRTIVRAFIEKETFFFRNFAIIIYSKIVVNDPKKKDFKNHFLSKFDI